ncbi:Uncharacterised protein [Gordonia terrae]|nr:Uncharacterised protein [Clostridioides difficile]VTS52089.1 Uncharacterised protein [Gordonia terrae]
MAEGPIELEIDFLGPILETLSTGSAEGSSEPVS